MSDSSSESEQETPQRVVIERKPRASRNPVAVRPAETAAKEAKPPKPSEGETAETPETARLAAGPTTPADAGKPAAGRKVLTEAQMQTLMAGREALRKKQEERRKQADLRREVRELRKKRGEQITTKLEKRKTELERKLSAVEDMDEKKKPKRAIDADLKRDMKKRRVEVESSESEPSSEEESASESEDDSSEDEAPPRRRRAPEKKAPRAVQKKPAKAEVVTQKPRAAQAQPVAVGYSVTYY